MRRQLRRHAGIESVLDAMDLVGGGTGEGGNDDDRGFQNPGMIDQLSARPPSADGVIDAESSHLSNLLFGFVR